MAKERINIMHELAAERDRGFKLDETVKLLKQQAELYQVKPILSTEQHLMVVFYL